MVRTLVLRVMCPVASMIVGCGSTDPVVALTADAAPRGSDAAGSPDVSGGDARTQDEGGLETGGPEAMDAAPVDAGGALALALACTGTANDVYTPPANLPPLTDAGRGDIVACTTDPAMDLPTVQANLVAEKDIGVAAVSAVAIYRVLYRTTRGDGSSAVSSARVYVPASPVAASPPVIVAAHGTEGLASSCATTRSATSLRELALPWAALGYPVIAPDYAGLGTPGVQGYEDNRDTARSVVDAVAALRKFLGATLGDQVVIDGHSQGGGAALATQALATSMGLQGTLVAVLAFAPEYYSHLDSLGFIGALGAAATTNPLTISTGVTKGTVATMLEYAYFANHVPGSAPTAGFASGSASALGGSIASLCTVPLGGAVQVDAPHVADWTEANLRDELLACVGGLDAGSTCSGRGQAFFQYLQQNVVPPDASGKGARVLLVQGLQDSVMPPDQEAACNVAVLQAGGLTPQVCTDATAIHTDVVQRNIAFGIQWAQAVLAGSAPPPCAASALPACSQP